MTNETEKALNGLNTLQYLARYRKFFLTKEQKYLWNREPYVSTAMIDQHVRDGDSPELHALKLLKRRNIEAFRTLYEFMWVYSSDGPMDLLVMEFISQKEPITEEQYNTKEYFSLKESLALLTTGYYPELLDDANTLHWLLQPLEEVAEISYEATERVLVSETNSLKDINEHLQNAHYRSQVLDTLDWNSFQAIIESFGLDVRHVSSDHFTELWNNEFQHRAAIDILRRESGAKPSILGKDFMLVKSLENAKGKRDKKKNIPAAFTNRDMDRAVVEGYIIGGLTFVGERPFYSCIDIAFNYLRSCFERGEEPLYEDTYVLAMKQDARDRGVFIDTVKEYLGTSLAYYRSTYSPTTARSFEDVPEKLKEMLAEMLAIKVKLEPTKENLNYLLKSVLEPMYANEKLEEGAEEE